jgi:hypothetical protein
MRSSRNRSRDNGKWWVPVASTVNVEKWKNQMRAVAAIENGLRFSAMEHDWWLYCLSCKALYVGPMANRAVNWTLQVDEGLAACPLCHKGRIDFTTEGLSWPIPISEWMHWEKDKQKCQDPSFVNCMLELEDWTNPDGYSWPANYDCFEDGHACGEPGWKQIRVDYAWKSVKA